MRKSILCAMSMHLFYVPIMAILTIAHSCVAHLAHHVIAEGNKIFADTARKDTWVIYHDHLNIWWDKHLQAYLKTLACPIEGWQERTWFDRQMHIMGKTNNGKIVKRYRDKVVGDTPEGQVLDCHLFAPIKETAGINVVMTCHLEDDDAAKYSFGTPEKTFDALERTIKEGEWDELAKKDWDRIWDHKREDNTWKRIKDAQGGYIEDAGKKIRSGVRRQLQDAALAETVELKPSKAAEDKFMEMERELRNGGGFGAALWMKKLTFVTELERVDTEDDEGANGEVDDNASIDLQESSSDEVVDDSDEEEGVEVELVE